MAKATKSAAGSSRARARVTAPVPSLPSVPSEPEPQATPTASPLGIAAVPRWKRATDSKMRRKVARILVLKASGMENDEVAKRLKTTPGTIRHYLYIAGKNGWLTSGSDGLELDPNETLVYDTAHKIVRNINDALDGKPLKDQQFQMTVEAAKGTGHFKSHSAAKVEGTMQIPNLEVKFEFPRGATMEPPDPKTFGGMGNYVDGQVIEPAQLTDGDDDAETA